MWLKNTWYVAGFEAELEQPFAARRFLDTPVVMFRTSTGEITALEDICQADLTEALRASVSATCDEDKIVLEQQQQQITRLKATVPRVATKLDEATMRARRLLEEWLKKESETPHIALAPLPLVEDLSTPVAQ